jgi:hypothetical protein
MPFTLCQVLDEDGLKYLEELKQLGAFVLQLPDMAKPRVYSTPKSGLLIKREMLLEGLGVVNIVEYADAEYHGKGKIVGSWGPTLGSNSPEVRITYGGRFYVVNAVPEDAEGHIKVLGDYMTTLATMSTGFRHHVYVDTVKEKEVREEKVPILELIFSKQKTPKSWH